MFLTEQKRYLRNPDSFPTCQLFFLALVRLAEPIALTSIFPYAWKLVLQYQVTDERNAAFYAGILISSFSLAEAASGMHWGGVSDRIGRKPVLLFGCFGTLLSLLIVGLAPNFWVALLGRVLGGLLNGNIGVIQTMVGELVSNPKHEPKAYAVMPFVWSIGTIMGPSIGGFFAEPATNFPNIISSSGIFGKFPYLLPNLLCAALLLGSIVAGYLCIEETHPDMQPWSTAADLETTNAETPLMPTAGATAHAAANLATESYGTFDRVKVQHEENWHVKPNGRPSSISSATSDKVFTKPVVMLVLSLAIFTYHSMTYDHLLPIFFQDKTKRDLNPMVSSFSDFSGGLGLTVQKVGIIMSVNGLIALFVQGVVFPLMASWFGIWRLFYIVTIGHPIAYFIVPYLTFLPPNWLNVGIYSCLGVRNFFSIIAYPVLLILIKEASPAPCHLGKINGLAASTGAACRTIASPVAGLLYGMGSEMHFTALAWWSSALIALVGVFQLPFMTRPNKRKTQIRGVSCRLTPPAEPPKDVVRIYVEERIDDEF